MAVNLQTIKEIRNFITGELAEIYPAEEIKGIISVIFSYVVDTDYLKIQSRKDERLTSEEYDRIIQICRELKTGKPIQYIIGETIFYGCQIKVNKNVLIPRQETEELVDLIIKENQGFTGNILDIGTGSGCIAIALAVNLPCSQVTATDISEEALSTAQENAKINNVKIRFLQDNIKNPGFNGTGNVGIIASNPPYVLNSEKQKMHTNILGFEPHEALFVPDDDPLMFYLAILNRAERILSPGGRLYFEINETMGQSMVELLESHNYSGVRVIKDINEKDRIVKGIKND